MFFNYFIADYLLKKRWTANKIKLLLTFTDMAAYLFLYLIIFTSRELNVGRTLFFLWLISVVSYFRTKKLDAYLKEKSL
jgi:hypothetical protein